MDEQQTYAPGDLFQSAGKTWQVVPDNGTGTCEGCEAHPNFCFDMPLCSKVFRLDKQDVLFKQIITV